LKSAEFYLTSLNRSQAKFLFTLEKILLMMNQDQGASETLSKKENLASFTPWLDVS